MATTEVKPNQEAEDGQAVVDETLATLASSAQTSATQEIANNDAATGHVENSAGVVVDEEGIAVSDNGFDPAVTNGEEESEAANGVLSAHEQETLSELEMESSVDESEEEKPKSFFRRRAQNQELKKLKAENEKLSMEVAVLRDRNLRLSAEMENFRKRTDRDFYGRVQTETARLLLAFLPLMDDLDRSLNVKDEARDYDNLLHGVRLIQQNFTKLLSDYGVAPMQAAGKEFDPNWHEALTEMTSESSPAGFVLEEHVKGYVLRDKVLRPAKVIVSKGSIE